MCLAQKPNFVFSSHLPSKPSFLFYTPKRRAPLLPDQPLYHCHLRGSSHIQRAMPCLLFFQTNTEKNHPWEKYEGKNLSGCQNFECQDLFSLSKRLSETAIKFSLSGEIVEWRLNILPCLILRRLVG